MQTSHTTNKIANPMRIDFNKLALLYPPLRPHVLLLNYRVVSSFVHQDSLVALATAILYCCLGLKWRCPSNNLCPRIPSRINYLLWVNLHSEIGQIRRVVDVGTGATLIYPLIGCKLFGWKFVATEIDSLSYQHSQALVQENHLEESIEVRLTPSLVASVSSQEEQPILIGVIEPYEKFDVLVCNPPFFQRAEPTISQMQDNQHHVEGGEYGFFFTLYRQSFRLPNIDCFTCLVGRLSSFHKIRRFLIEQQKIGLVGWLKFGEIEQGSNIRYIVAWRIYQSAELKQLLTFDNT